jgi:hypothetical protein
LSSREIVVCSCLGFYLGEEEERRRMGEMKGHNMKERKEMIQKRGREMN